MLKKIIMVGLLSLVVGCSGNSKDKHVTEISGLTDNSSKVDLEKAAKLNVELGLSYLKQQQIPRAKSKLNRAKRLAPHLPEVHYAYGFLQEQVGDIENAEKSYLKAIALNPKGGNEHNNYGAFLCRQHKYSAAEKEFLRAIEQPSYTNTAEALENAGLCVLQIPEVAKAVDYFEKTLRYDQNRSTALLELAIIKMKAKKTAEAKEYFARYNQVASPTHRSLSFGIELARATGDRNKEASYRMLLRSHFPGTKQASLRAPSLKS